MKKVLITIGSLFCILLVVGFSVPFLFKDKIIAKAYEEIEKQINATTRIGGINLSILNNLRNFPDIALSVKDVVLIGKDEFEGDTLLNLGNLRTSLDIMSVINGSQYKINAITLKDVYLNALVNKSGHQNWNILKDTTSNKEESSPFNLSLKKITLDNININYDDLQQGNSIAIRNIQHNGRGDFSTEVLDYISKTTIASITLKQGITKLLSNAQLKADNTITIDQKKQHYKFSKNEIQLNDLALLFDGNIELLENAATKLDVTFNAKETTFKSLLSLIPAIYTQDFEDIKSSGTLKLDGNINGLLHGENYPNFKLHIAVNNGEFQYPKLPVKIEDVFLQALIQHQQGNLDKTLIDISKLNLKIGQDPIAVHLKVSTPISNPNIDFAAKGKINLANVQKFYPMEDVKELSGTSNVDLTVKTKLSDIEQKNYQAIVASGSFNAVNVKYSSTQLPHPVAIDNLLMNFTPQFVSLDKCNLEFANSDFDIKGRLDNFLGYVLSDNGILSGNLNLNSNQLDANQFLPDSSVNTQSKTQQAKEVVRIPKNIDFTAVASIQKLLYDEMNLQNVLGTISIKEEQLNLNNLSANLLGGAAVINGFYNTQTDIPTAKVSYDISDFDIQQVYQFVNSAEKTSPIMKYMQGKFSSDMNITTSLLPDLSPNLNTISGNASFLMPWANISGVPAMKQIVDVTHLKQFENMKLENIDIKTTVANGRILVEPFTFKANNLTTTVGGSQGLDQSLDYDVAIDVPWKELKGATSFAQGLLAKNPIQKLNNAIPDVIRINLKVGGTFKSPKITVGKPDGAMAGGSMKDVVKENMQEKIADIKDQAKEQAKQTFDTVKTQIKEQAKNKLNELITGQKDTSSSTTAPVQNVKDNVKDKLKGKLPWQR